MQRFRHAWLDQTLRATAPFFPMKLLLILCLVALFPSFASARVWVIAQRHASADDAGPGTAERPFRSVAPAAAQAGPGDTVRVHAGVYRERVAPARSGEPGSPITFEAAPGEFVVLSGSDVLAGPWTSEPDGLEAHSLAGLGYESHWQPYRTSLRRLPQLTCGMIFADGERLWQARSREQAAATPGSWWYEAAGDRVLVNFFRGRRAVLVEAAVRERVFAPHLRGLGHIVVRGFTLQHAANQFPSAFWVDDDRGYPQAGALGTRSGHHWLIEGNLIRENANLGLDLGVEGGRDTEGLQPTPAVFGDHVVRANRFEANGAGAIAGFRAPNALITDNLITGTNWQGHTAPETGGIKLHFAYNVRIERNHIHGNDCFGVWLDNVYTGARVLRNLVHDNRGAGIFIEMGGGPGVVAWNIVAENRGEGIYLHDASDVLVAHNLVALNRQFGFFARTVTDRVWTDRERGDAKVRVGTHRVRLLNNIFVDNGGGDVSLPFPSEHGRDNVSDHNLYLVNTQWQLEIDRERRWHMNLNDGRAAVSPALRAEAWAGAGDQALRTGYLDFETWRRLAGQDRASVAQVPGALVIENGAVERGGFAFAGLGAWVRFARTAAIRALACPPLPEVGDTDYFGHPASGASLAPGPFQSLAEGEAVLGILPRRP